MKVEWGLIPKAYPGWTRRLPPKNPAFCHHDPQAPSLLSLMRPTDPTEIGRQG